MKIVVTGGICSGKSTVCNLLSEKLGIKYASIDEIVHDLYKNNFIQNILIEKFGTINRELLSAHVFNNPNERAELEEIFAPYVKREIDKLFILEENYGDSFILEFPLLFELAPDMLKDFDFVITVTCPPTLQLERVIKRDGKSHEATRRIIESQTTDPVRFVQSDAIIYNSDRIDIDSAVDEAINKLQLKMAKGKIGIVSGSFDPITIGHTWVIQRALEIVDHVVIAIAHNPNKKYLLSQEDRLDLVKGSLTEILTNDQLQRISVDFIPSNELTVSYAVKIGAKFLFRGLRGATDLEYENQLNLINKKIAPEIETIYLLTPRELIEISSSLIKSALDLREWERVAAPYVSKCVFEKLKQLIRKTA